MSLIDQAAIFAARYHKEQKYGTHPYIYHLFNVIDILLYAGLNSDEYLAAAWLHDIVEDTVVSHAMIRAEFGQEIHQLVYAVTGHGKNRKERNADIYEKLDKYFPARNLKLADRIANIEQSISENNVDKFTMYYQEHLNFFSHVKENTSKTLIDRYLAAIEEGKKKGLVLD